MPGVAAAGPDALALFRDDGRRARVLAHRQLAFGGDRRVAKERERHATIVVRGLGVVEDRCDLLQVPLAVEERDLAERFAGEEGERLRCDAEHILAVEALNGDVVLRKGAELRGVGALEGEEIRVAEIRHGELL